MSDMCVSVCIRVYFDSFINLKYFDSYYIYIDGNVTYTNIVENDDEYHI